MKNYGNRFEETMPNGMKQHFRICKTCGMWIPDDEQILVDHSATHA